MERIQISSVSGSMCFDTSGRGYRIIGNGTINDGDYVFAHGGCVYGYEQSGGGGVVPQMQELGIPIETSATFGMIGSKSLKYKLIANLPAGDGSAFINDVSNGFFMGNEVQTNLVSGDKTTIPLSHGILADCCVADDGGFYVMGTFEADCAIYHNGSVCVNLRPILDGAAQQIANGLLPLADEESKKSVDMAPTPYSIDFVGADSDISTSNIILNTEDIEPGTSTKIVDRIEWLDRGFPDPVNLHPLSEQPDAVLSYAGGGSILKGVVNSDCSYEFIASGSATFNTWNYEPIYSVFVGSGHLTCWWWWSWHVKSYGFNMTIKNGEMTKWELTSESLEPTASFNRTEINYEWITGKFMDSHYYNPKMIYPLPDGYTADGSTMALRDPSGKSIGQIGSYGLPRHVVKRKDGSYLMLHPSGVALIKNGKVSNIFVDSNNQVLNYRLAETSKTMKFKKAIAALKH